jgi:hypothetical protein
LKLIIILFLLFNYCVSNAQNTSADSSELISWPYFTQKAKFIYGEDSLINFLKLNVKYPSLAIDSSFNTRTVLKFEIDSADNLSEVKAVFCSVKGYGFEAEAIRALKQTELRWKSAMRDSQKVGSYYRITIKSNSECSLAIDNTIYHVWDVDIQPKMVDYGSIQEYVLSELEWPAEYGLVCGHYAVIISFVVDEFGYVSAITNESDTKVPTNLVEAAQKFVLKTNGKWQPAQINSICVKCKMTIPLIFDH